MAVDFLEFIDGEDKLSSALTLSATCSGRLAPISADVTRLSLNVQASAI